MQTGSNYTAQDISGLRMQDNLKTNITIYSSFMISVLSPDVNFHYHIANKLNYFDQNWIIFCIGESICRYARWKFWKGLFANQTHYTRLWICPNVKIQESFCTESFIFILLCDCLNDCLIASLNYCTFLWYFWYIRH